MIELMNKYGVKKLDVREYEYNGAFMGEKKILFKVSSAHPIIFELDDYAIYRGNQFKIYELPDPVKVAHKGSYGQAFQYNVVLEHIIRDLDECSFLDYVISDNNIHYSNFSTPSFYGTVNDLALRIEVNLSRLYEGWTVTVDPSYESSTLNIQVSNLSCLGALNLAGSLFHTNYVVNGKSIVIGREGEVIPEIFEYKNGLMSIEEVVRRTSRVITRLRSYGSKDNLPLNYNRGTGVYPESFSPPGLMLPNSSDAGVDYIDSENIHKFGIREGSVYFDGMGSNEKIHPTIKGMTAERLIAAGVPTASEGALDEVVSAEPVLEESQSQVVVSIKDIGFDINDHLGTGATLSIESGECVGSELAISKVEKTATGYDITVNRKDEGEFTIPNLTQNIKPGDKFVLLGIMMPDVYVKAAEQKLLEHSRMWLSRNDHEDRTYTPRLDNKRIHESGVVLQEGLSLRITDADLNIDSDLTIQNITIKYGEDIPIHEITLGDERPEGLVDRVTRMINEVGEYSEQQIRDLIRALGDRVYLSKIAPDTARGLKRFIDGIEIGEFISGIYTGSGGGIDKHGNAEFQSLTVRGSMRVLELIINRLSAIEGDQVLTESDTIESIVDLGDGTYGLYLREKWEGYFTGQVENNVIRGMINTLASGGKDYYTSWMRVNSVNAPLNYIEVTLYPDSETPDGINYPPVELMKIARWGNQTNEERQSCIYISSTEGRIVHLTGVTKPIIDAGNYGSTFGSLPEFLKDLGLPVSDGRDGVYVKQLFTQNIIRLDHLGRPMPTFVDRGEFDVNEDYYSEAINPETEIYETSDVWYLGCKWRCMANLTKSIPRWNNTDWAMIEGNPHFTVDFMEAEAIFDPDNFNTTLTILAKLYNQDVTDDIRDTDIVWTRYSEDLNGVERVSSDNAWALRHAGAGKSISLTADDADFLGYVPRVLRFTATVTLRDGITGQANIEYR